MLAERAAEALPLLEAVTAQVSRDGFKQFLANTDPALGIARVATGARTQGVRTL